MPLCPCTTLCLPSLGTPEQPRATYARRVPEDTVLYETIRGQLETFLARAQASGRSVPAFVEREGSDAVWTEVFIDPLYYVHAVVNESTVLAYSVTSRKVRPVFSQGTSSTNSGSLIVAASQFSIVLTRVSIV